jgi:hypothetical protein
VNNSKQQGKMYDKSSQFGLDVKSGKVNDADGKFNKKSKQKLVLQRKHRYATNLLYAMTENLGPVWLAFHSRMHHINLARRYTPLD